VDPIGRKRAQDREASPPHTQFVEQLDITENSLFFGKKSMRFKSGDPLDIFLYKTAILDVKKYLKIK
jgi:hypothetical protein